MKKEKRARKKLMGGHFYLVESDIGMRDEKMERGTVGDRKNEKLRQADRQSERKTHAYLEEV